MAVKPVRRAKTGSITGLSRAIYAAKPAAAAQNTEIVPESPAGKKIDPFFTTVAIVVFPTRYPTAP